MRPLRSIRQFLDTIGALVVRDQKVRYKTAVMGMFWAIASPVLFLMTFYFLFNVVLPLRVPDYAAHLFIGIVVWGWFQGATMEAVSSIVANAGLLAQPGFPIRVIPIAVTCSHLITLLLTLPILIIILATGGASIGLQLLAVPVVVAAMFIFILAVAYLVAALNVIFRDIQHIVPILLQLGYFATPIFYDWNALPMPTHDALAFNPMLQFIEAFRNILMRGIWPDWLALAITTALSAGFLWLALTVFRRASHRFLEEL